MLPGVFESLRPKTCVLATVLIHSLRSKAQVPGFVHGQMCASIFCCKKVEKQGVPARNVSFQLFIPI